MYRLVILLYVVENIRKRELLVFIHLINVLGHTQNMPIA